MVEFTIKIHPKQGTAYIPKEIREALGTQLKGVPNLSGLYVYPEGTDPKDALKSLDTIRSHLEHQVELKKKKEAGA